MELNELVKLKSRFVSRVVCNELILVPLAGSIAQMSEMFTLNATARFIWENVTETTTVEEMVDLLTDQFEIDSVTSRNDILAFINKINSLLLKK